jgi:hypothetical protein
MFLKTGLDAAKHHFDDNVVPAFRAKNVHLWNLSVGLSYLCDGLEDIERRLRNLEKQIEEVKKSQQP